MPRCPELQAALARRPGAGLLSFPTGPVWRGHLIH